MKITILIYPTTKPRNYGKFKKMDQGKTYQAPKLRKIGNINGLTQGVEDPIS